MFKLMATCTINVNLLHLQTKANEDVLSIYNHIQVPIKEKGWNFWRK